MALGASVLRERLNTKEIIKNIFNLSDFEIDVYFLLLNGIYMLKDIVDHFGRSKSSTQRAINTLLKRGLIERTAVNSETGVIQYGYRAKPIPVVKEKIKELLKVWQEKIFSLIKSIESSSHK